MSTICIIGFGAILPQAANPDCFWRNLQSGTSAIRRLPATRWDPDRYCRGDNGSAVCNLAGFVDDAILSDAAANLGLSTRRHNRLQIMTLAAADQAMAGLRPERAGIFLGCMDADEAAFRYRFLSEEAPLSERSRFASWDVDPEQRRSTILTSSVLQMLQDRFRLRGEAALIDAACASSLAAIDLAVRALEEERIDFALTGGIESNLGPDTFMLFSRLGALSPEPCLPFDIRSQGLTQGEGAVLLALERLEHAQRLKHNIVAVIGGTGASSDGAGASLFEPTSAGQLLALSQAYRMVDPSEVDYVECHGTGTPAGDATELETMRRFFSRPVPVGSAKAVVGHTKGAAGATGLLKCILAMHHRVIPPSPYCSHPRSRGEQGPFVNTAPVELRGSGRPLRFGVSSFGFGGVNYHINITEPCRRTTATRMPPAPTVVVVARYTRTVQGVRSESALRALPIPPRSLPQIDELQLAAVRAVHETAAAAGVKLAALPAESVSVISASTLGLDACYSLSHRVRHSELDDPKGRDRHPRVTEDTGPGVLNNVIAGRVANHFDFKGTSFNIDADLASEPAALWVAGLRLCREHGLTIVLAAGETYDDDASQIVRRSLNCWFIATLDFALAHSLPIESMIDVRALINVTEKTHAIA
jgi:acyl transferase domain-containing protein